MPCAVHSKGPVEDEGNGEDIEGDTSGETETCVEINCDEANNGVSSDRA